MKTDLENLANHIAAYGREPHTLQVETKCGKSWMTVYDTLGEAVQELMSVIKQWGADAIDANVAPLSMPNSNDPVVSVDEGGTSSVEDVAAATGDSVEEARMLLVKPTRAGVGGKID